MALPFLESPVPFQEQKDQPHQHFASEVVCYRQQLHVGSIRSLYSYNAVIDYVPMERVPKRKLSALLPVSRDLNSTNIAIFKGDR